MLTLHNATARIARQVTSSETALNDALVEITALLNSAAIVQKDFPDAPAVLVQSTLKHLEAGVATKTHVLNLLHRLVDGKPAGPDPIAAPQALSLMSEPRADVARYDTLRAKETAHAS